MSAKLGRWLFAFLILLVTAGGLQAQAGSVSGRIRDAQTDSALAGARVELLAPDGRTVGGTFTDDQGGYRIANVPAGAYTLSVTRVGYSSRRLVNVTVSGATTEAPMVAMVPFAAQLNPTITTASRTQEKALEAPATVSVVTAEQIMERAVVSPVDHVKGVPGMDVAQTGLVSANFVTRGFNNVFSGGLLVLQDNRFTSVPSLRVNAPFLIPVANEDIERIEVVLGPGAALYGPNSAGGVLHMITRSPITSPGTALSIGGGERDVLLASGRHAGALSERFGYKVSGTYMQGTDWPSVDSAEVAARAGNPDIPLRNFDIDKWSVDARLDARLTENSEAILNFGRSNAGSAIEMTGLGAAQVRDWSYDYIQGRVRWNRLFAQAFMNSSDAGNTFLLRTGNPIVDKSRVYVGQAQHGFDIGHLEMIYGVDLQRTFPETEGTITGRYEDMDNVREIGGYVHSTFRLNPRIDIVGALRVDEHNFLEDPVWSPRAALVLKPAVNQTMRLTYNRAFSTPTSNNLFLDLVAGRLPIPPSIPTSPVGYNLRALGVARGGLQFARDGEGALQMRPIPLNPAAPPGPFVPMDASQIWNQLRALVPQFQALPAPPPGAVGMVLRTFNTTTLSYGDVQDPSTVTDIAQLSAPTINTYEVGYTGVLGGRVKVTGDVYFERRENFIGPLIVETPNAFINPQQLGAYLSNPLFGLSPQQVQALAGGAAMIPIGVVALDHPFAGSDLIITYRNFGRIDLWGGDLGLEGILTERLTLLLGFSMVSDNVFDAGGGELIALNSPARKGSIGMTFRDDRSGFGANFLVRANQSFPMNSGVYIGEIESATLVDAGINYRLPGQLNRTMLSVNVQNIFNEEHQYFIGAPRVGRLALAKLTTNF